MAKTLLGRAKSIDKNHYLYMSVILAVIAGAIVGLVNPEAGVALKPLGDGFVALIKMMIAPVIFCTIAIGDFRLSASVSSVSSSAPRLVVRARIS